METAIKIRANLMLVWLERAQHRYWGPRISIARRALVFRGVVDSLASGRQADTGFFAVKAKDTLDFPYGARVRLRRVPGSSHHEFRSDAFDVRAVVSNNSVVGAIERAFGALDRNDRVGRNVIRKRDRPREFYEWARANRPASTVDSETRTRPRHSS
ncbi:MAG: hypothetical protein ACI8TX_002915 [Hyphomicrobiaceae bacterium]|jgi:hypothetical protein